VESAITETIIGLVKDSGKLMVDEVEQPEQAASVEKEVGPMDNKSGEAGDDGPLDSKAGRVRDDVPAAGDTGCIAPGDVYTLGGG
jgi:hypothetical protein